MRVRRSPLQAIGGGIFFIFLALAFLAKGAFFLPILFVGLALSALIGTLSTMNHRAVYGGIYGFVWFLGLAFCFVFGFWPWILFVVGISAILGALMRPLMASLAGIMGFGAMVNNVGTQPEQPYQQPGPAQQQPYQQGYQPPSTPESYQEGGKQHQYPSAPYEQPQSQYPQQELPPQ
jgi:hypothetical protein